MSKYTTELRYICENNSGLKESKGFNSIDEILKKSAPNIFNFDYPIFDNDYRLPLEIKILRTYYTREISEETVGLWKLRLQTKLCNIMPYYNQLYKSALLEFNPFYDTDLTTEHNRTGNTNTQFNSEFNSKDNTDYTSKQTNIQEFNDVKDKTVHGKKVTYDPQNYKVSTDVLEKMSDTPQGSVDNLKDGKYLTTAKQTETDTTQSGSYSNTNSGTDTSTKSGSIKDTINRNDNTKNNAENESNSTTHIDNLENYLEHIKGKQSSISYSKMLKEYRETFLNIDNMIIEELSSLFFNLW